MPVPLHAIAAATLIGAVGSLLLSATEAPSRASVAAATVSPSRSHSPVARVVHGGVLRTDATWSADVIHVLASPLRVTGGAVLHIEAGVRIEAAAGTSIVVERTARITAIGTEAVPIVFTCGESIPTRGCWLGVLIAGNASVVGGTLSSPPARGVGAAVCAELPGDGFHGSFGGCDPEDDSGELRFVRVEYASRGLELLGVGRGTRISSVQVHDALATAVTLRGGTVDLRRIIASSFGGTAYAWTDGWQGRAQHLVAHRLQGNGAPAFDGRNMGASGPTLWQTTIVGDADGTALRLVGSGPMSFRNVIVVGTGSALDLDGAAACASAAAGDIQIGDVVTIGVGQDADADADTECALHPDAEATLLAQPGAALRSAPIEAVNAVLSSALTEFLPDLRPLGLANALDISGATPPADGFFEPVDRLGGVEPTFGLAAQHGIIPWYSGWTAEGSAPSAPMGIVTGTVRTTAGVVISDVRVRVSTADRSARSGSDGSFTVGLARPGTAVVTAELLPDGCVAPPVNVNVVAGAVATADLLLTCGSTGFDPAGIQLTYLCGTSFRVKNPHPVEVPVTWDVYGTSESGILLLPPATGALLGKSFFTVSSVGTVRLFYQGVQIDAKANGGFTCKP
ncbi:MAG: carboxypeptidase-like regulatory domain-containing protein [Gemmatimonadaceae bacterium]